MILWFVVDGGGLSPRSADLMNIRQHSGVFHELERIYGAQVSSLICSRPKSGTSRTSMHSRHNRVLSRHLRDSLDETVEDIGRLNVRK